MLVFHQSSCLEVQVQHHFSAIVGRDTWPLGPVSGASRLLRPGPRLPTSTPELAGRRDPTCQDRLACGEDIPSPGHPPDHGGSAGCLPTPRLTARECSGHSSRAVPSGAPTG